jgi:pilus assembly protein Flp/PilA
MNSILRFLQDDAGVTAIEYAFIAVIISISVVAGAQSIGTTLNGTFNTVAAALK